MQKLPVRATLALFISLYLGLFTTVFAATPADSDIKSALYDISRYEKQFAGKTSERASVVRRVLKLLTIARERLDASTHKSHPSWQEADSRYNALVGHLQSMISSGGSSSGATTTSEPTKTTPSTNPSRAQRSQQPTQMISQQRVRVKKLYRDIKSAMQTMDQGGIKPFQDPAYVQKFTAAADRFQQSLNKYANFASDPDVQTAANELQTMRNMLKFGNDQAAATLDKLGDVQGQLRTIYNRMQASKPPSAPQHPYADHAIPKWIEAAASLRRTSMQEMPILQRLKQEAYLPTTRGTVEQGSPFDMQDVNSMIHGLQRDVNQIDSTLKNLEMNLTAQLQHVEETLQRFDKLDPASNKDRSNSFLNDGAEAEAHKTLNKELQVVGAAVAFDKRLKRQTLAERQALYKRIEKTRMDYDAKRTKALQLVRMPKSASTDPKLIKIAQDTLAYPKYEVGKIVRLVINTKLVHREKESSEVEFDKVDVSITGNVKLSGTQTTTRYEWDQYQVATAEPVGDKYYIFYNTLKYFTAGATTTPLNQWILSGRLQSTEIPLANIQKD